jgi:hypothetical protein
MINATTAASNVAIGDAAMSYVPAGVAVTSCVAIGNSVMSDVSSLGTNATGTIAIGGGGVLHVMKNVTGNTAVGYLAFSQLQVGEHSTALGYEAGRYASGSYNTFLGYQAGKGGTTSAPYSTGYNNVAVGKNALDAFTSAVDNVAVGIASLGNATTGYYNVAIGSLAGLGITTGAENVAIGRASLYQNSTGIRNTAVGYAAAENSIGSDITAIGADAGVHATGSYNTFVGSHAGKGGTTSAPYSSGTHNTALGYRALTAFTTGVNNVALGDDAGDNITTGGTNVLIGRDAGDDIVGGGANICIGYQARAGNASRTNGIVIGYNISATADNDFSFGKASNVVTNDFDADADWSRSSDARLKRNVQDTSLGLDFVNDLRPVKFQWKPSNEVPKELTSEYNEENQKNLDYVSHGFIAQEVKEVVDKHGDSSFGVWQLDGDGETQRIKKNMLVMPLVKAVQELSKKVEEQQKEIEELKKR